MTACDPSAPGVEAVVDHASMVGSPQGIGLGVAGWAFARNGHILAVQVWAGQALLGYLPYGFPRPDVRQHFGPDCSTDQVGFEGIVELPAETDGASRMGLRVVLMTDRLEKWEVSASMPAASSPSAADAGRIKEQTASHLPAPAKAPPVVATAKLAAPNFFILGAGKCGTTSLYHALRQHPQIQMPEIKEPSFFSSGFQVIKNPVDYFNLFPQQEGKIRHGEASHVYFSAPEAAPILRQLFPTAKFILILRNPVNRAHSLYQHMRRTGDEPLQSFEEALAAEDRRFSDPAFRRDCPQYFWNYMYRRSSCYDEQLGRYLDLFPKEQFFFLTLGEWKSAPATWTRRIFEFLGVGSSVEVEIEPQNQAGGYAPLLDDTRQRLAKRFEGMRERLQGVIGRELQHWDD